MARPARNFGDHDIEWLDEANAIVIRPRYPNASMTDWFGLGNALIALNAGNLPEQIIVPITGETTGEGILPTSPFKLKRWHGAPTQMSIVTKTLTGFDNWEEDITYPEAGGGSVKEATATAIIQSGYGCEHVPETYRTVW